MIQNHPKWAHSADDIPKGVHWVIIEPQTVTIPAMGHGWAESKEQYFNYIYFTNEEDWKNEIQDRERKTGYKTSYVAMKVIPATITTNIDVNVNIN